MKEEQLRFFSSGSEEKNTKRRFVVNLSLDTLLFSGVAVVLLLVLIYSLGIEKGRKMAHLKEKIIIPSKESPSVNVLSDAKNDDSGMQRQTKKEELSENDKKEKIEEKKEDYEERYTIQVGSYLKQGIAQVEAKKLEEKGYSTKISKKGKFQIILVGEFKDKSEAQKDMKALRARFKDCFLRRL